MKKLSMNYLAVFMVTMVLFSCSSPTKKESAEMEMPEEEEPMMPVATTSEEMVVSEHVVGNTPVTSHGVKIKADSATDGEETYEVMEVEEIHESLVEEGFEKSNLTVTETIMPIDETQTIVSYKKKNEQQAVLQVVSNANGEVEYITFTDKKHKDEYDVKAGMSGKEVKRLRKEIKHMEHKGDHFLYDDQSNIMYVMDVRDTLGNEITEIDIENMEVRAIVWKDKKGDLHSEMISN